MKSLNQYLSSHVDEDSMVFNVVVVHVESKLFYFVY